MKEKMVTNSLKSSIKMLLNDTVTADLKIVRLPIYFSTLPLPNDQITRITSYIRFETFFELRNNL